MSIVDWPFLMKTMNDWLTMCRLAVLLSALLLVGIATNPQLAIAQIVEHKLFPTDATDLYWFGNRLSVSGDGLLVGTHTISTPEVTAGVYMFRNIDGHWIEEQKLVPSNGSQSGLFGQSVALVDSVAYVGSQLVSPTGSNLYAFRRVDGFWIEEAAIEIEPSTIGTNIAWSIAASDESVLVGMPVEYFPPPPYQGPGSAVTVRNVDGALIEEQRLQPGGTHASLLSGYDVALSGETAFVGACKLQSTPVELNAVCIYEWSGGLWELQQVVSPQNGVPGDRFGWQIAVNDNFLLVGARRDDGDRGAVYVFQNVGGTWVEQQKLTASDVVQGDFFGRAIAVQSDLAVISSSAYDGSENGGGVVYTFRRSNGVWSEESKLTPSDSEENDDFGSALAIEGGYVFVGAKGDDTNGEDSGAVYVYEGIPVGVEQPVENTPLQVAVINTFPNPTYDQVTIEFAMAQRGSVSLRLFDLLGREVDVLIDEETLDGQQELVFDVAHLLPGVYILRLDSGTISDTTLLTVLR